MDGDGSSSSGDVSSTTAADEGPLAADSEVPQPNVIAQAQAQMRLYNRNMLLHRVQSDPNVETEPRDGDGGDGDEYGSFFILGAVPASGVAIACLPETTVGIGGEGEAREIGQCAVCIEEYEAGDALRTMPCEHGFHERCIFEWLRVSRLCPLCRFALPAEEDTN